MLPAPPLRYLHYGPSALARRDRQGISAQPRRRAQVAAARKAAAYDFRRPDRIAKDQLRAIHLLHDNFARNLASSLSGYLRAYVIVNLISVEQLSFAEFTQCLPSPTVLVTLGMKPFDGNAVMELNPSLVFPLLEMLLGGSGKGAALSRETTEIEQSILDTLFRIILQDLSLAWQSVANIAFSVEGRETEPQLLQILSPNEAVVSIGLEIRVGDSTGLMNIGLPSIIVKMLRHKFDQQWSVRKGDSSAAEQTRILNLLKPTKLHLDARLEGPDPSGAGPDDARARTRPELRLSAGRAAEARCERPRQIRRPSRRHPKQEIVPRSKN